MKQVTLLTFFTLALLFCSVFSYSDFNITLHQDQIALGGHISKFNDFICVVGTGTCTSSNDMIIAKISLAGKVIQDECIGGAGPDGGFGVAATVDNTCIAAGFTFSSAQGRNVPLINKLPTTAGGSDGFKVSDSLATIGQELTAIKQLSSKSYIAVGAENGFGTYSLIDPTGNLLWTNKKNVDTAGKTRYKDVVIKPNGDFAILGNVYSSKNSGVITFVSGSGTVIRDILLTHVYNCEYEHITQLANGNLIVTGNMNNLGKNTARIVHIDASGNILTTREYPGAGNTFAVEAQELPSKNILVGARTFSTSNQLDYWILELSMPDLNVVTQKTYGTTASEILTGLTLSGDGSFIASGYLADGPKTLWVLAKPIECPMGKYKDQTTGECTDCPDGTYNGEQNILSMCTKCPVGTYSNASPRAKCIPCSPGSYSSIAGAASCTLCPAGKYQSNAGSPTCNDCPAGFYQSDTGKTFCTECPTGTFGSTAGGIMCNPCPAGKYSATSKSVSCISCPEGKYAPASGSTMCLDCPIGYYNNLPGASVCTPCTAGTISDVPGSKICTNCPAGTYMPGPAKNYCIPCPEGNYQDLAGQSACKVCAAGYFAPMTKMTACILCPIGKYIDTTGSKICNDCAAGYFSETPGQASCKQCPEGMFQPVAGKNSCMPCQPGYYSSTPGSTLCTACPAGKYQNIAGSKICNLCPVGTFAQGSGSVECTKCYPGTYQSNAGSTTCNICPAGKFSPTIGAAACIDCPIGSASKITGAKMCGTCSYGTYSATPASLECTKCAAGTYQDTEGKSSCIDCPAGKYNGMTEMPTCFNCAAGYYQPLTKQTSCIVCPAGTSSLPGAASCTKCPIGSYAATPGTGKCILCPAGSVSSSEGSYACTPCPLARYMPYEGKEMCYECPPGKYQDEIGKASCKDCDPGYYQPRGKAEVCNPCPAGTYTDISGSVQCKQCPVGTFSTAEGSTSCTYCPAGKYSDIIGSTSCKICPTGTYQSTRGSAFCNACPVGFYAKETGLTQCVACPAGTFQAVPKSTECTPCPLNYFMPTFAAAKCIPCPEGQFTNAIGSTSCLQCEDGFAYSVKQSKCLYKGLYETKELFFASDVGKACYDTTTQKIIVPYTADCKTKYRATCCAGGNKIDGVNCNMALGIDRSSILYDRYCSACPFSDRSACPADGLCWNESKWTDSNASPYPDEFSKDCLYVLGKYCAKRLLLNPNDNECSLVSKWCGADVSRATYDQTGTKLTITFNKDLPDFSLYCSKLFEFNSVPSGPFECSRLSPSQILVTMDNKLPSPILSFRLLPYYYQDKCGSYIPSNTVKVIAPTPAPEQLSLTNSDVKDCNELTVDLNIQKPYPWAIPRITWKIEYVNNAGISSEIMSKLSYYQYQNQTKLVIPWYLLVPEKTIEITALAMTPFSTQVTSNKLSIQIPPRSSSRKYCGACQFDDRAVCDFLNGICWKDHHNASIVIPSDNSVCLKFIAGKCYNIWKQGDLSNSQCLDFAKKLNYTQMTQKPNITGVAMNADSTKIIVTFNIPISKSSFSACEQILDESTLRWLTTPRVCVLISSTTMMINYNPQAGTLSSIKFKGGFIRYDYEYSQVTMDEIELPITLPEFNVKLSINAPSAVSECEYLPLYAALSSYTTSPIKLTWYIGYISYGALPESEKNSAEQFFSQIASSYNTRVLVIPNRYLASSAILSVGLIAKPLNNIYPASSQVKEYREIRVYGDMPKLTFLQKSEGVTKIEGNLTRALPITLTRSRCNKPGASNNQVNIEFSVESSNSVKEISEPEEALSKVVKSEFDIFKTVLVATRYGFQYRKYYKITASIKNIETQANSTDSIVIYFVRPPIKIKIETESSLVSIYNDVEISSLKSIIPEADSTSVKYTWSCVKCISLSGSPCECPLLYDTNVNTQNYKIPKSKLMALAKYVFGLTINADDRYAYAVTEFVTYTGPSVPLVRKVAKPKLKDQSEMYLSCGADLNFGNNVRYNWAIVGVKDLSLNSNVSYTQVNSFIYNFFTQTGVGMDRSMIEKDNEIPKEYIPVPITPANARVFGFDSLKLKPNHEYSYAVAVIGSKVRTFLIFTFTTPPLPRPRTFTVTPTSGEALTTEFQLSFYLTDNTQIDEANYQIYRRDCSNSKLIPLTKTLGTVSGYSMTLALGTKKCDYQVELIVRASEYESYIDSSVFVNVTEPQKNKDEIIKEKKDKLTKNNDTVTPDEKISILQEITTTPPSKNNDESKDTVKLTLDVLTTIESSSHNTADLPQLLETAASIIANLLFNYRNSVDITLAVQSKDKIDNYFNSLQNSTGNNAYLVPSAVNALSGVVNVGNDQKGNTDFFKSVHNTVTKMTLSILVELQPSAPAYKVSSDSIEMSAQKKYANDNSSYTLETDKGNKAQISEGVKYQQAKNNSNSSKRLLQGETEIIDNNEQKTVGTTLLTFNYNPFAVIKNHTKINEKFLNASISKDIAEAYKSLATGDNNNNLDLVKLESLIMQMTLKSFIVNSEGEETEENVKLTFGQLPAGQKLVLEIMRADPNSPILNDTAYIPLFFVKDTWVNGKCKVVLEKSDNNKFYIECEELPEELILSEENGFVIAVDCLAAHSEMSIEISKSDLNINVEKYGIISGVAVGILLVFMLSLLYFCMFEKREITDISVECLRQKVENDKPHEEANGCLNKIYKYVTTLRFKYQGIAENNFTSSMTKIQPYNQSELDMSANTIVVETSDYTKIRDVYVQYKTNAEKSEDKEFAENQVYNAVKTDPTITRIVQEYIEEENVRNSIGIWELLKSIHFYFNSFARTELYTSRTYKMLILLASVLGMLAMTGYLALVLSLEEMSQNLEISNSLILFAIYSSVSMVIFRIILSIFIVRPASLETKSTCFMIRRFIGCLICIACVVGTLVLSGYIAYENSKIDIENWLICFGISVAIDFVGIQLVKMIFAIIGGWIMVGLAKCKCGSSCPGLTDSILGFIFDYF